MGNLVPIATQVQTKQGELLVTINLNLNIKLDEEGKGLVTVEAKPEAPKNVKYEMPDIQENTELIEFGKEV
jgi:uncharacterized protein YdhG (YjbR/CyaY superfamily)